MSETKSHNESQNDSTFNPTEAAANTDIIESTDTSTITLNTSMAQIGSMLYYISECEFLFSQTNENYEAEIYNGRGFLLKMLGQGLKSLNIAHVQQVAISGNAIENLQTLEQVKVHFEQLVNLGDKDSDQAHQLQQSISTLLAKVA